MTEEFPQADEELMLLAGAGDLRAFEELVRRHQRAVIGTAAKMLGPGGDPDDIAQMVFVRAWKSAPRYRPTAKFTTWLMTITRHLVFNETRRRKQARHEALDATDEEGRHRQFPDNSQKPADVLAKESELVAAIDDALASLPEKPRLALILRRYENMPYEDIARTLGVSVPAVKSLLFRARSDLKSRLSQFLD